MFRPMELLTAQSGGRRRFRASGGTAFLSPNRSADLSLSRLYRHSPEHKEKAVLGHLYSGLLSYVFDSHALASN